MRLSKKVIGAVAVIGLMGVSGPTFAAEANVKSNTSTIKVSPAKTKNKVKNSTKIVKKGKIILDEEQPNQLLDAIVKSSKVTLNHRANFYDSNGKKDNKTAKKNKTYTIYQIRTINNDTFYKTKNNLWLKSDDVRGTVKYQENEFSAISLITNKKGKLTYLIDNSNPVIKEMIVKYNSYVYDNSGQLDLSKKGTVTLIKKGKKVKSYGVRKVGNKKFYITDSGWIKYKNLEEIKNSKK